jgi:tetratricopeptide (TPR) repeat protein
MFPLGIFGQSLVVEVNHLFNKKEYTKAEELISDHVKTFPDDIEAIELLGDSFSHQLKWDQAILNYKKLVDYDNTSANYHYKYGGALGMKSLNVNKLRALGLIGDVKRSFLKAAELDPEHIDVRWALVELYMRLPGIIGGSKKKSLYYAEELKQLSKVDGFLAKGYIYEYDDEPELAEKNYLKAIDEGGSINCFDKLTQLYVAEDMPEEAVSTIEKAHKKHNKNALHYQIGKVCADYNVQLEKGEQCLKTYIENHTARDVVPIEWAYLRLAQIYKNKLDKKEALKWINKALEKRTNFKQALEEKQKILALQY